MRRDVSRGARCYGGTHVYSRMRQLVVTVLIVYSSRPYANVGLSGVFGFPGGHPLRRAVFMCVCGHVNIYMYVNRLMYVLADHPRECDVRRKIKTPNRPASRVSNMRKTHFISEPCLTYCCVL